MKENQPLKKAATEFDTMVLVFLDLRGHTAYAITPPTPNYNIRYTPLKP